jgi:hypothetical protein
MGLVSAPLDSGVLRARIFDALEVRNALLLHTELVRFVCLFVFCFFLFFCVWCQSKFQPVQKKSGFPISELGDRFLFVNVNAPSQSSRTLRIQMAFVFARKRGGEAIARFGDVLVTPSPVGNGRNAVAMVSAIHHPVVH